MEVGAMYTLCCEFEKRIHLGDEEFHDVRDELGWQLFHSRGVGPPSHPSLSFAALLIRHGDPLEEARRAV